MSKTALLGALKAFDLERARGILARSPELARLSIDPGYDLLQFCCSRSTQGDESAAQRQLRMAKWLIAEGFDPQVLHRTAAGEDGEERAAELSLVWFAVAKARNPRLARHFLALGAEPGALYAAVWWGMDDIVPDLVRHGADLNVHEGATPLHMAVDVAHRGTDGRAALARRRLKVVEVMLRLGADPDIPASDGTTPLHTALKKGYLDVFRMLLRHGADPDIEDGEGRTVRRIAARKKDAAYRAAIESARPAR